MTLTVMLFLILMCVGLVLMNAGFSRRRFSLFVFQKSLAVFFFALLFYFLLFPRKTFQVEVDSEFLFWAAFYAISCLILIGSANERLNLKGSLMVVFFWSVLVFLPFYVVTKENGWLAQRGFRDFAGGLLVHGVTGASALGLAAAKGRRLDFFSLRKSGHLALFGLGALFVFVGWLAFNVSGVSEESPLTALALQNTFIAGALGFLTWTALEFRHPPRRASLKGGVFGMISGLVAITPVAGWSDVTTACFCGITGAVAAFYGALLVEKGFRWDDEMKVFASHFLPSWIGILAVSWTFSSWQILFDLIVPLGTLLYGAGVTFLVYKILNRVIRLTLTEKEESEGPDLLILGESSIEI